MTPKPFFQTLLREPFFLFTAVSIPIFALASFLSEPERPSITISQAVAEDLVSYRSELLGRSLTTAERSDVIREYVDSEILIREAVARGYHLQDGKVRQRLAAKMAFLLDEEPPVPTARDLEELQKLQPEKYLTPELVTFNHVFFADDRQPDEEMLERLQAGEETYAGKGDRFWLGQRLERYTQVQLITVLGGDFVRTLGELPVGQWTGPIESGRGQHLVQIEKFHPREIYPPEELERQLQIDWKARYRERVRESWLARARQNYVVTLPARGDDE